MIGIALTIEKRKFLSPPTKFPFTPRICILMPIFISSCSSLLIHPL